MPSTKQTPQQLAKPQDGTSQGDTKSAFARHLEYASAVVESWPTWKQQILGEVSELAAETPARSSGSNR